MKLAEIIQRFDGDPCPFTFLNIRDLFMEGKKVIESIKDEDMMRCLLLGCTEIVFERMTKDTPTSVNMQYWSNAELVEEGPECYDIFKNNDIVKQLVFNFESKMLWLVFENLDYDLINQLEEDIGLVYRRDEEKQIGIPFILLEED